MIRWIERLRLRRERPIRVTRLATQGIDLAADRSAHITRFMLKGGRVTNALMMTSQTVEWATPQGLFDELDAEFHFTVDAAADASNAKCDRYWSIEDSGLSHSWDGETIWCNPPYGRAIAYWVEKAATAIATTVMLLPVRTDVRWFHEYVLGRAEIRFIAGRIKFGDGTKDAPFPCMIVIFRGTASRDASK